MVPWYHIRFADHGGHFSSCSRTASKNELMYQQRVQNRISVVPLETPQVMDFLQTAAAPESAAYTFNSHGVVEMLKKWMAKFTEELRELENTVEVIQLIPQERISERTVQQLVDVPVPDSDTTCESREGHSTGSGSAAHRGTNCRCSCAANCENL